MAVLPKQWSPQLLSGLLLTSFAATGLLALAIWSDKLITQIYNQFKPILERQIGQVMGHPLSLGAYQGMGWDGIRIGPSGFGPGLQDRSTASVSRLKIAIDPIASWRRRAYQLELSLDGAQADLRLNNKGQIWVMGEASGGEPPPIALRIRVSQPARLRFWGFSPGGNAISFNSAAQVGVQLRRSELDLRARISSPNQSGALMTALKGRWNDQRWRANVKAERFALAALQPLLPVKHRLLGSSEGRLKLRVADGKISCAGSLTLRQLRWRTNAKASPLEVDRLPLTCNQQELVLGTSRFRFDGWQGQLAARASTDRRLAARLKLRAPDKLKLGSQPILATLRGRQIPAGFELERLQVGLADTSLNVQGLLGQRLDLNADWRLNPANLSSAVQLPPWLLEDPIRGTLQVKGPIKALAVTTRAGQARHPLVGRWTAALQWRNQLLRLESFQSKELELKAELPLTLQPGRGLMIGELDSRLTLRQFNLSRLGPLVGARLRGNLTARGVIRGPLANLKPDLSLRISNPAAGPLLIPDDWQGQLSSEVSQGPGSGGHTLMLNTVAGRLPSRLVARLDANWLPVAINLERGSGRLRLSGSPKGYGFWVNEWFRCA